MVYQREVLYNGRVEARVVITQQKQVYLFRTSAEEPDFTFSLNKHIKVRKLGPLEVRVTQSKKVMLFKEEVVFEFTLEFNLEGDLREFVENLEKQG